MMLHMMKKLAVSAGGVKVASPAGCLTNMVLPHVPTEVEWQPSNPRNVLKSLTMLL